MEAGSGHGIPKASVPLLELCINGPGAMWPCVGVDRAGGGFSRVCVLWGVGDRIDA